MDIRQWQVPFGVGALWGLAAYASLLLREASGGVLLLWTPSAVAVAALAASPRSRWPRILAAIIAAMFVICGLIGIPHLNAAGFALAQAVEAVLCVTIGRRVLGASRAPRTFRHLTGMFLAALAASAASTLVSIPFRISTGPLQNCWWFLSATLGILVCTPILVHAWQAITLRNRPGELPGRVRPGAMAMVFAVFSALSLPIFAFEALPLVPLLFCALVITVLRAGQLGAAAGVFAFAVTATGHGLWSGSPPLFGHAPFVAGLMIQGYMLLMLATALPLAAALLARKKLEEGLHARNAALKENLTVLNLAKTLAGIGRWRIDLRTGRQDWSEHMRALHGLAPELGRDPGDIRDFLPDGGAELFGKLASYRQTRIPYSFEYAVETPDKTERILKLNVCNEFDAGGRIAISAVAMDVTDERHRERALVAAKKDAFERAAIAQRLANTDPLTGLANRRSTFDWLDQLLAGCEEAGEPLSILMFDIDRFKRINDTYGHQAGDEVLCRVADLALAELRAEDLLGRIGGEEFACLLPGMAPSVAALVAQRLCLAIANGTETGTLPQTTISIGLAYRRPGDGAHDLIARADKALYGAKDGGRNQVREAA